MSARVITIIDNERDVPIEAALRDDLAPEQLLEAEREWRPARLELLQECKDRGVDERNWPQHWHWNWEAKARYLEMLAGDSTLPLNIMKGGSVPMFS